MLFSNIGLIDETFQYVDHQYIGIRDDKIAYIGSTCPQEDFGEVYDGAGKFLMPGLYNAHSHSAMTLLRGYAEDMQLQDWLFNRIFPFEAQMTHEDYHAGVMLAIAEMLSMGIVSTTDMYFGG